MTPRRLEHVDANGSRTDYSGPIGNVWFDHGLSDEVDVDKWAVWRIVAREDGGGGIIGPNVRVVACGPVATKTTTKTTTEGEQGPEDPPPAPPPATAKPDRMAKARAARAVKAAARKAADTDGPARSR